MAQTCARVRCSLSCSVLKFVAMCVAVCCRVSQCVTVLQFVAVWCSSMVQYGAVWCSMVQYGAV